MALAALLPLGQAAEMKTPGDRMFARYFENETKRLAKADLAEIRTLGDWKEKKNEYRHQLREMLGLDPLPERTPLQVKITGTVQHDEFEVRKLHYQSSPGLYVTGNLYVPKKLTDPAPAILYVCGHGRVQIDGVNYGNKTHYQHHGAWFARNGYVCLTIDTIQLGELEGIHHGTYRHRMWWWNSRGYTPAGVEAWNGIRAIDLLESLDFVDKYRIGVTGRSGGGAYSWWIATLDERIKAAAPVAGITDLQNHVVDGVVEGHCDCMFQVNTYRWDFAQVAALVAPRPLLILNTDRDGIFPIDGVTRLHAKVARIYELHGKPQNLGLAITPGGHSDSQELRIPAFNWFNKHLKGDTGPITTLASKEFTPRQLKVYKTDPADERTTTIHDSFPRIASGEETADPAVLEVIRHKSFGAWPSGDTELNLRKAWEVIHDGVLFAAYDFDSQPHVRLRMYVAHKAGLAKPEAVHIEMPDEAGWKRYLNLGRPAFAEQWNKELKLAGIDTSAPIPKKLRANLARQMKFVREHPEVYVTLMPRGTGLTRLTQNERHITQTRRRFMLLGQTLAGQQALDIRQCIAATHQLDLCNDAPLELWGYGHTASLVTVAALFEDGIRKINLRDYPANDKDQPDYLNISRFATPAQLLDLAKRRTQVKILKKRGAK